MVDISTKKNNKREAKAVGVLRFKSSTFKKIIKNQDCFLLEKQKNFIEKNLSDGIS